MKKLAIVALVAGVFLAACSSAATAPSPTAATITPIPSTKATTAATAAPATQAPAAASQTTAAATKAATSSAPAASSASGTTATRKVDVGATNTNYSIGTLDVKPGEKIEFVLKNSGDEKHNLVGVGEGISLVSPDFDSGSTVSWIWTAPTKLGTFKLQCSYHTTIPPIVVTVKQ